MKLWQLTATGLGLMALTGCANVMGPVPAALSFYASPVDVGVAAKPVKRGEACAHNILGIIATGDASMATAKQSAGITRIASVEQSNARVAGYYARFCTIVKGE